MIDTLSGTFQGDWYVVCFGRIDNTGHYLYQVQCRECGHQKQIRRKRLLAKTEKCTRCEKQKADHDLSFEDYTKQALTTLSNPPQDTEIDFAKLWCLLRMSTAIGSMLDLYKRKLIYGKEIPEDKMEQYFAQLQKLAFSQGQTPTDPYTPTVTVSTDMGAIHAILGILTESNELAERLTNNLFKSFYNGTGGFTEEDLINFQEETGDLFWYIALLHETLGLDNQEVLKGNIRKLEARYKGKFSAEAAINRDTEKEMVAMRRVK